MNQIPPVELAPVWTSISGWVAAKNDAWGGWYGRLQKLTAFLIQCFQVRMVIPGPEAEVPDDQIDPQQITFYVDKITGNVMVKRKLSNGSVGTGPIVIS